LGKEPIWEDVQAKRERQSRKALGKEPMDWEVGKADNPGFRVFILKSQVYLFNFKVVLSGNFN
jgi:hypothetical protein